MEKYFWGIKKLTTSHDVASLSESADSPFI